MQIVVTGLIATYPLGGVSWDYLQYIQGDQSLGHRSKKPSKCSRAAADLEDVRVFGLVEHCDQARIPFALEI